MAAITAMYHKFDNYIDRTFGPAGNYIFAFPPHKLLSSYTWIHIFTALCIITPLAMITVLLVPYAFSMENTAKSRVRSCSLLLLPLNMYVSETLFNGIRDPAFRIGTCFCAMNYDTLCHCKEYHRWLTCIIQTAAPLVATQKRRVSSDDGKKPDGGKEKQQTDSIADREQVRPEKMKVFIVSNEKK